MTISLTQEQNNTISFLERTREHTFITGLAGTGKSVVLREFRDNTNKEILVCAPTGAAARNVDGITIHNLLGMGTGLPPDEHVDIARVRRDAPALMEADALVVDEVSMVSSDLLDSMDRVLRRVRDKPYEPFGGLQMIFFGDLYQLPPVLTQEFEQYINFADYRSAWFFDAHVWEEAEFHTFGLTKVHRQSDDNFKVLLNAVRDGTIVQEQVDALNQTGTSKRTKNTLLLGARRKAVKDYNMSRLKALRGPTRTLQARVNRGWGIHNPAERELLLKAGSKVIMLSNDREERRVNGTQATVENIETDTLWIRTDEGDQHAVARHQWIPPGTHPDNIKDAPKFVQFPVSLAWALTIHKSQGQSLPDIEVDMGTGAFEAGQTYVALSRVTSPGGLHLKAPLSLRDIRVDPNVRRFFHELNPG